MFNYDQYFGKKSRENCAIEVSDDDKYLFIATEYGLYQIDLQANTCNIVISKNVRKFCLTNDPDIVIAKPKM